MQTNKVLCFLYLEIQANSKVSIFDICMMVL